MSDGDPPPVETPTRLARLEDGVNALILFTMAALPLVEMGARLLRREGLAGTPILVQHLTLCVALCGAALAAREERLLALSTGTFMPARMRANVARLTGAVAALVAVVLSLASVDLVRAERDAGDDMALGIPVWWVVTLMPVMLALIAWRLVRHSGEGWRAQVMVALPAAVTAALWLLVPDDALAFATVAVPYLAVGLVACTAAGLPMFATLAGLALLYFFRDGTPLASVPVEMYRLTASPLFPAIPLFTLGGYVLTAGSASGRLVRVFDAWVGWLPGGPAIVTTLCFAFFTSFTGASGVTILSMGGLLMPVLLKTGYSPRFSLGLLTTSGSIGLLFPPSLPVILYAVSSQTPMDLLFVGGLIPGVLLVGAVALLGVVQGLRQQVARPQFRWAEARSAAWHARWELLLPVVVMVGIFGGFATLTEAASLTVGYALLTELVVHRDPVFRKNLRKSVVECATLTGGVLLILGVAMGLTNYLMDAQIPMKGVAWVQEHVHSREMFLLILNVCLLGVGAAMDIYSAILVVVPLIAPMAVAFGVDPVHLGIIFLANLELGYLLPPVGENLFLSSYRFNKPIAEVFRATLPFVLIIFAVVMLITYVPVVTLGPVHWWQGRGG